MFYSTLVLRLRLCAAERMYSGMILGILSGFWLTGCQGLNRGAGSEPTGSLEQAELAWRSLASANPDREARQAIVATYNQAIAGVIKVWRVCDGPSGKQIHTTGIGQEGISFDPESMSSAGTISLRGFTGCRLAAEVPLQGFSRVVGQAGLGVPVILTQDDPSRVNRPFHPPKGEFIAATAVIDFPGDRAKGRLKLYNPLAVAEVRVGASTIPLASNFTAQLQCTLTDSTQDEDDPQLLPPSASGEEQSKLFYITPYDPSKVPVVFVHGLRSGPVIWKNAINELLSDPDLRRRYQPVVFVYPSGLPIPTSAARLRQLLKAARTEFDPDHSDAGFNNIVIVGHSMGGLVARMQAIDSGRDFWNAFYTASPREVASEIDPETVKLVRTGLIFNRLPNVKTVVFITTPHRGSELADVGILQRLGQVLLALPQSARKRFKPLKELPETVIHPALRPFNDWGHSGVENLSTKHPYFQALARRPITVPFHSVIGVNGGEDPLTGTDGVVPYWSAHLKGAASEAVVPYPHGCVEMPGTVNAVIKVLKGLR